jgi:hypothetical protein
MEKLEKGLKKFNKKVAQKKRKKPIVDLIL